MFLIITPIKNGEKESPMWTDAPQKFKAIYDIKFQELFYDEWLSLIQKLFHYVIRPKFAVGIFDGFVVDYTIKEPRTSLYIDWPDGMIEPHLLF